MASELFRPASRSDLAMIVELKLLMFAEAGFFNLLAHDAPQKVLVDYQHLYEEGKALHYIVEHESQIVAMVGAFVKSDLPFRYYKTPIYGFIGDVYTKASHRQQGFAKRLNEHALGWLKLQGVTMVRLLATETARPIYETLGFNSSDEMVLYFKT